MDTKTTKDKNKGGLLDKVAKGLALALVFIICSIGLSAYAGTSNELSNTASYIGSVLFQSGNISLVDRITGNSGSQIVNFSNVSATTGTFNSVVNQAGTQYMKQGDTWTASQNGGNQSLTNLSKVQGLNVTDGFASISNGVLYNVFLNGSINRDLQNLVSYWTLDESSAIIASDSSSSYDGVLYNMNLGLDNCTNNCSGWTASGKNYNGLIFDGINDYVEMPDINTTEGTTNLSLSLWAKRDISLSSGGLISKDTGGGGRSWFLTTESTNNMKFRVYNSTGTSKEITFTNAINDADWNHYVLTLDVSTGTIILYRNGILHTQSTLSNLNSIINTNGNVRLGRYYNSGYYFNGTLDDVRIYNSVLTKQNVQDLFLFGGERGLGHLLPKFGGTIRGDLNITSPINESNVYCQKWVGNTFIMSTIASDCV